MKNAEERMADWRVTGWVVRFDDLYVRSANGRTGAWFRGTWAPGGRIWAGGVEKDVTFAGETDPDLSDKIDAVCRTKHRRYEASIVSPQAPLATIRLVPRPTGLWGNNHSALGERSAAG
jgi:hypothetical protein